MLAMEELRGSTGVCGAVTRRSGVAGSSYRREKNNMRRAHKKAVGELTIDTTFAKANHQPVRQCCSTRTAPPTSPQTKYGASIVNNWILLGARDDMENVEQLHSMGVTHILSICGEYETNPAAPQGFPSCIVVVNDCSDANIERHFSRAFDFIDRTHMAQGKVLVQCRKGISRSATLVIAYLMRHHRWTFEKSYNYVKKRRSVINPNLGFVLTLENYGRKNNFGSASPPSVNDAPQLLDDESALPQLACSLSGSPVGSAQSSASPPPQLPLPTQLSNDSSSSSSSSSTSSSSSSFPEGVAAATLPSSPQFLPPS